MRIVLLSFIFYDGYYAVRVQASKRETISWDLDLFFLGLEITLFVFVSVFLH